MSRRISGTSTTGRSQADLGRLIQPRSIDRHTWNALQGSTIGPGLSGCHAHRRRTAAPATHGVLTQDPDHRVDKELATACGTREGQRDCRWRHSIVDVAGHEQQWAASFDLRSYDLGTGRNQAWIGDGHPKSSHTPSTIRRRPRRNGQPGTKRAGGRTIQAMLKRAGQQQCRLSSCGVHVMNGCRKVSAYPIPAVMRSSRPSRAAGSRQRRETRAMHTVARRSGGSRTASFAVVTRSASRRFAWRRSRSRVRRR